MYSKDGVYNLFRALKDFLRKPTPGKYKHLMENKFDFYLTHYFKTPNWDKGANQYITLANALHKGFSSVKIPLFLIKFSLNSFI